MIKDNWFCLCIELVNGKVVRYAPDTQKDILILEQHAILAMKDCKPFNLPVIGTINGRYIIHVWDEPCVDEGEAKE